MLDGPHIIRLATNACPIELTQIVLRSNTAARGSLLEPARSFLLIGNDPQPAEIGAAQFVHGGDAAGVGGSLQPGSAALKIRHDARQAIAMQDGELQHRLNVTEIG